MPGRVDDGTDLHQHDRQEARRVHLAATPGGLDHPGQPEEGQGQRRPVRDVHGDHHVRRARWTSSSSAGEDRRQKVKKGDTLHLPVAFVHTQGDVSLSQSCAPDTIKEGATNCSVVGDEPRFEEHGRGPQLDGQQQAQDRGATGAKVARNRQAPRPADVTSRARRPASRRSRPVRAPSATCRSTPSACTPDPIGDEEIINFNVPSFVYGGVTYTSIGVDSNGYLVLGGGTSEDNNCCNLPAGPGSGRPNNVLAPFWTDLDGTGAPGIFADVLTDGVNTWLVIEYRVNVFGTNTLRRSRSWIGIDGTPRTSPSPMTRRDLPANPAGQDFLVGAENDIGQGDRASRPADRGPASHVDRSDPRRSADVQLDGPRAGRRHRQVTTEMDADGVLGDDHRQGPSSRSSSRPATPSRPTRRPVPRGAGRSRSTRC